MPRVADRVRGLAERLGVERDTLQAGSRTGRAGAGAHRRFPSSGRGPALPAAWTRRPAASRSPTAGRPRPTPRPPAVPALTGLPPLLASSASTARSRRPPRRCSAPSTRTRSGPRTSTWTLDHAPAPFQGRRLGRTPSRAMSASPAGWCGGPVHRTSRRRSPLDGPVAPDGVVRVHDGLHLGQARARVAGYQARSRSPSAPRKFGTVRPLVCPSVATSSRSNVAAIAVASSGTAGTPSANSR